MKSVAPHSAIPSRLVLSCGAALLVAVASGGYASAAQSYVWLEGEKPSSANVPVDAAGSSHGQNLSGGKVLQLTADPGDVAKKVPADGAVFKYAFKLDAEADYHVWDRIGFESARCPFQWRIDDGAWKTVTPDEPTLDLMELDFFREIGWLELGIQHVAGGEHALEFRVPRYANAKGQFQRMLYTCDCICITPEEFHPNSKFEPGESGQEAADVAAGKVAYDLPETKPDGRRSEVALSGAWEICRDDERLPGPVAQPIAALPQHPVWRAITVPGDKNELRHDYLFAHRIWYRTRVNVPASAAGRSFHIVFPQNNLNTTVYVNGDLCGFQKHPYVHFQIDVSKGIKLGMNEICIGIRDAWYGFSASPTNPLKLRRRFNLPLQFSHNGFQDLAYPVWNAFKSGILVTPTFVSTGRAYVSDVFCKPSVAKKSLALDVTLENPTKEAVSGDVVCAAVNAKTGAVEKTFAASPFQLAAGQSQVLQIAEPWQKPKLWWPDDPNMYRLRATVRLGGKDVDASETLFGFREWRCEGKNFTLNGYVWHGWNMDTHGATKEKWLESYHKQNQTQTRICGAAQGGNRPFFGMSPDEALDWFDRHGVVVRRCGPLDGEAIGYLAIETDPELKKLRGSEIKLDLLEEWSEQMAAQVRGERNHPCVQIWSIENEWLYINCINLYANLMDKFEAETIKAVEAVRAVDPTRPCMTDGGAANKAQDMPVHGNHYVADANLTRYPALAYEANVEGGGRGRWVWDKKRPRYLGEDFFYTGNHPELSTVGGEAAFGGKASTLPACGLMLRILQQGYRWADYGAWDFYCGEGDADNSQWTYMAPRVVLCRQWDWTFGAGQTVERTMAVFNDSHDTNPITVKMRLEVGGKKIIDGARSFEVTPGTRTEFKLNLPMPQVEARQEGQLLLDLEVKGQTVWSDTKAISILPSPTGRGAGDEGQLAAHPTMLRTVPGEGMLAVYDPAGSAIAYLKSRGLSFTALDTLSTLPQSAKVLVLGNDALDARESTSSRLAAYASQGRTVIALEQKYPLKYQALPAEMETAVNEGRVGFAEDLDHPVFRGLAQKDFFTWGPDEILFRNAYRKPVRGARSLLQCGQLLENSGIVEVPAGQGLLLLSQVVIGEKIAGNAVAQTLFDNLLRYAASYKLTFRPATAAVSEGSQLATVLGGMGLQYTKAAGPLAAIQSPGAVAVVEATSANLRLLADHQAELERFTQDGGFLILNGLTPDGLASYNKIVGFEHVIRPFKRERVLFPPVRDPLTAGLSTSDVALYGSQRIFPWTEGNYVVSDEFSYIVDFDEVAPFGKSSFFAYDNIVNGFVNADGWPLIINFPINADGSPYEIPITLPKPQTITEFTWIGNTNYYAQTKVELVFDDDKATKASYDVAPSGEPQVLPVNPPRTAQKITLVIAGWQEKPGSRPLVGIDNIYFHAQRPAEFYRTVKPMLNIGGMLHYVRGSGGIVLCNLKFQEREDVPANAVKKQNILASLLRNLKAPFSGGRAVIAGSNLEYAPIDLSKHATQYRDQKGWFGDRQCTFRDLPTGRQRLAGVDYDIYEFATSPAPTVIMLAGKGLGTMPKEVKGIAVGRKADALFFLHAARIDRRMDNGEWKKKRCELFRYVVRYADGTSESVPVYSEIDVDSYRQESPLRMLPGAQIAWAKPYEGTNFSAVAYSMQWNNPHPGKEIAAIDVVSGTDAARGVPAVLAISAATAVGK